MIATKKLAVLMTAMIIGGVVGISVATAPLAEANTVNTTRSNIKSLNMVQQDGDVACTNQAQGQGGQQAIPNTEQNAVTGEGDPVPDIDYRLGVAAEATSEGDPVPGVPDTFNAEQSNDCSLEQNLSPEQNAESGDDFSTNEWTE
jgi:hypothetical protein